MRSLTRKLRDAIAGRPSRTPERSRLMAQIAMGLGPTRPEKERPTDAQRDAWRIGYHAGALFARLFP